MNLNFANRVIAVDPWYNETLSQQAFGRVDRFGQEKETHLVRLFSESDVDRKLSQMQVEKGDKISYSLQDDGHTPVEASRERIEKLFDSEPAKGKRTFKGKAAAAGKKVGTKGGARAGQRSAAKATPKAAPRKARRESLAEKVRKFANRK